MGLSRNHPRRTRNGVTNNEIWIDEPIVMASASFILLFVHTSSTAVTHSAFAVRKDFDTCAGATGRGGTNVADHGYEY